MDRILEDFIDRSSAANSEGELGRVLTATLGKIGVEQFAVSSHVNDGLIRFVWDEMHSGFGDIYRDQQWSRVDPHLRKASCTNRAFIWRTDYPGLEMPTAELEFLQGLRHLGMSCGMMAGFHRPGGRYDILSICSPDGDIGDPKFHRIVHALGLQAWTRLSELAPEGAHHAPALTPRELECLQWVRDGKTNWEISQIFGVSEKTVEFHVGNIMRKLHADSRLAAVIFALRAGILSL